MALNTRRRIALALALACGAADLAVKAAVGGGLRHERGPLVALISLAVAVALPAVVPRLPSTAAAVAAGIGSGGAVGNGLSPFTAGPNATRFVTLSLHMLATNLDRIAVGRRPGTPHPGHVSLELVRSGQRSGASIGCRWSPGTPG